MDSLYCKTQAYTKVCEVIKNQVPINNQVIRKIKTAVKTDVKN